jgi:hypothetical protein
MTTLLTKKLGAKVRAFSSAWNNATNEMRAEYRRYIKRHVERTYTTCGWIDLGNDDCSDNCTPHSAYTCNNEVFTASDWEHLPKVDDEKIYSSMAGSYVGDRISERYRTDRLVYTTPASELRAIGQRLRCFSAGVLLLLLPAYLLALPWAVKSIFSIYKDPILAILQIPTLVYAYFSNDFLSALLNRDTFFGTSVIAVMLILLIGFLGCICAIGLFILAIPLLITFNEFVDITFQFNRWLTKYGPLTRFFLMKSLTLLWRTVKALL